MKTMEIRIESGGAIFHMDCEKTPRWGGITSLLRRATESKDGLFKCQSCGQLAKIPYTAGDCVPRGYRGPVIGRFEIVEHETDGGE